MLSIALGQNRSVCMFVISIVTSISASPYCDRTSRSDIIREKTKNKDCANRNRHVPSATDRLSTGTVIFPMSKHIDYCLSQSDRTSRSDGIREKAKNKVCQLSCAKCHQSIINGHCHLPEVETHRSVPLPVAIGPAVRTLFAKGLKIKCANRHVPSATNRFSMGTVIFPMSNHID